MLQRKDANPVKSGGLHVQPCWAANHCGTPEEFATFLPSDFFHFDSIMGLTSIHSSPIKNYGHMLINAGAR
jgi:hypothetical protein